MTSHSIHFAYVHCAKIHPVGNSLILLIFVQAGLFSASVTAFIIESSPNAGDLTRFLCKISSAIIAHWAYRGIL